MTDKELLDMLLSDPRHGLEQAVRLYTPYVMKIASVKLSGLCTKADIEEVVSDIFMSFYQSITRYGSDIRSIKALLAVIARRKCADTYEQMIKHKQHISYEELSDSIPDGQPDYNSDRREALIEALHSLGQPDEQIFIRKYFFGQTSKEIANDLKMKTNTVDKRISRGLIRLRKIIEEGE